MERCVFRDYFVEEFGSDLPSDWRPYLFESINDGKHIFVRGAVARIKKKGKQKFAEEVHGKHFEDKTNEK